MSSAVNVPNEVIDKFHRALCPKCRGICAMGFVCMYDYEHKKVPEPDVNAVWRRYLNRLAVEAERMDKSLDEILEILKDENDERFEELSSLFENE